MELRYRMALVTGAGGGLGRELAIAVGRRGMSVLAVDRDRVGAERTATLVRACRVAAWSFQVDLADGAEVDLLAGRARDLGGADVLVSAGEVLGTDHQPLLWQMFLGGVAHRRRPESAAAFVDVLAAMLTLEKRPPPPAGSPVRRMSVVVGRAGSADVCAAVVDLLGRGAAGQVVELVGD